MKKTKLLEPIIFISSACMVVAPISTITSCSCHESTPDPVPSEHIFTVEKNEYKISDNNTISFKIKCEEKDNHILSNITLFDGQNKLSNISEAKEMKNGELDIIFENIALTADSTNNGKITFKVDVRTDVEEISNIIISKNIQPGPEIITYELNTSIPFGKKTALTNNTSVEIKKDVAYKLTIDLNNWEDWSDNNNVFLLTKDNNQHASNWINPKSMKISSNEIIFKEFSLIDKPQEQWSEILDELINCDYSFTILPFGQPQQLDDILIPLLHFTGKDITNITIEISSYDVSETISNQNFFFTDDFF